MKGVSKAYTISLNRRVLACKQSPPSVVVLSCKSDGKVECMFLCLAILTDDILRSVVRAVLSCHSKVILIGV